MSALSVAVLGLVMSALGVLILIASGVALVIAIEFNLQKSAMVLLCMFMGSGAWSLGWLCVYLIVGMLYFAGFVS
jgi:hypothetical protein